MKSLLAGVAIVAVVFIATGCTTTQKGAATGSAVGAGVGAVVGHQSGETAKGAAVGAAAGGLAGALIGERMDSVFCPDCGNRYVGGSRYCPYDGAELKPIRR